MAVNQLVSARYSHHLMMTLNRERHSRNSVEEKEAENKRCESMLKVNNGLVIILLDATLGPMLS